MTLGGAEPRVAVCAIVKDEVDGIVEWVAYHRAIGAAHLFVFDNGSGDGTWELLQRMALRGHLTAIRWVFPTVEQPLGYAHMLAVLDRIPEPRSLDWSRSPVMGPQIAAYNHAVAQFGDQADWFLFIDADEFLLCRDGLTLPEFAARFGPDVGAVAINWVYFGSNGQLAPDGRLVMERFTRRARRDFPGHGHMKTLARPQAIDRMAIHACTLRQGRFVDDRGQSVVIGNHAFTPSVSHAVAQVNHYSVKSVAEFRKKMRRGLAPYADTHPNKFEGMDLEYFTRQDLNDEEDTEILRWRDRTLAWMERLKAR